MRCPKCHYLSFEPEPRCRNCGYDLALGPSDALIKPAEGPLSDFELHSVKDAPHASRPFASSMEIRGSSGPEGPQVAPVPPTAELPLFVQGPPQPVRERDEPLVKLPRAPRPPLSVRRPTPAPGRVKEKYQLGLLERDVLGLETDAEPAPIAPSVSVPLWVHEPSAGLRVTDPQLPVGALRRLEAAVIDALFVGAINVAVIWLTLQSCDLTVQQTALLPILPMLAFLFLVDGGYLLMFTATSGQTVGKMAAGIRVVGTSDDLGRLTLAQAAVRSLVAFPSVLALGAGFFPALSREGLAVHDRVAHTRVVRA